MIFLLDGYNILAINKNTDIEKARNELIAFVRSAERLYRHSVIIFFDGSCSFGGHFSISKACRVIFSGEKSADDAIIDYVIRQKKPNNIWVVTNDRELQRKAKANGCQIKSNDEFLNYCKNPPSRITGKRRPSKDLPADAHKITEELARIWLKNS